MNQRNNTKIDTFLKPQIRTNTGQHTHANNRQLLQTLQKIHLCTILLWKLSSKSTTIEILSKPKTHSRHLFQTIKLYFRTLLLLHNPHNVLSKVKLVTSLSEEQMKCLANQIFATKKIIINPRNLSSQGQRLIVKQRHNINLITKTFNEKIQSNHLSNANQNNNVICQGSL